MQGVIQAFEPTSGSGTIWVEPNGEAADFDGATFAASGFQFLRQGQRLVFELDSDGHAINLRLGSENDMATTPPPGV